MPIQSRQLMAIVKETMAALGVLAIFFLSFGHQPFAAPSGYALGWTAAAAPYSVCGSALPGDDSGAGQNTCPVCQIGAGMSLPFVPRAAGAPVILAEYLAAQPLLQNVAGNAPYVPMRPRAPPAA